MPKEPTLGPNPKNLKWWPETDLNRRHEDLQSTALPTELSGLDLPGLDELHVAGRVDAISGTLGDGKGFFRGRKKRKSASLLAQASCFLPAGVLK